MILYISITPQTYSSFMAPLLRKWNHYNFSYSHKALTLPFSLYPHLIHQLFLQVSSQKHGPHLLTSLPVLQQYTIQSLVISLQHSCPKYFPCAPSYPPLISLHEQPSKNANWFPTLQWPAIVLGRQSTLHISFHWLQSPHQSVPARSLWLHCLYSCTWITTF